mgnify:CR=1 FL=1|tara:strand:- start:100 stop:291 length:192 start_codon:yes stop_codon:yes gene_type:complete
MEDKIKLLKEDLENLLNKFYGELNLGKTIDDLSLEDLDEFAELLDNYLDFRIALEETGSKSIQ